MIGKSKGISKQLLNNSTTHNEIQTEDNFNKLSTNPQITLTSFPHFLAICLEGQVGTYYISTIYTYLNTITHINKYHNHNSGLRQATTTQFIGH